MAEAAVNAWFRLRVNSAARIRLFCFPHAGGGASLFVRWPRAMSTDLEICPCQLPGHEDRIKEASFTEASALLDALTAELDGLLDRPFAFFGHSLGAHVAFQLAHRLGARGGPSPVHVFVSGSSAPGVRLPTGVAALADTELLAHVVRWYGGIPPALLREPELVAAVLPAMRADFQLFDQMATAPAPPLDAPISAFGGLEDPTVSQLDLGLWASLTRSRFRLQMFEGDHFYLRGAEAPLLQNIAHDLEVVARSIG
jgi:medium-chain acyl-[acyl-carrier-protein] hydrolase